MEAPERVLTPPGEGVYTPERVFTPGEDVYTTGEGVYTPRRGCLHPLERVFWGGCKHPRV